MTNHIPQSTKSNAPCTVGVNALLMQNFSVPSQLVTGLKYLTVGHQESTDPNQDPEVHVFGATSGNKVYHYQRDASSMTGWKAEQISLPSSKLYTKKIVCGTDTDGKLVVFVMAKDSNDNDRYKVYYRKTTGNAWTYVGRFSDSASYYDIDAGTVDGELVCRTSFTKSGNNSLVQQIDWKKNATTWTDVSNPYNTFYALAVGPLTRGDSHYTGVFASRKNDSSDSHKYEVAYYHGSKKDSSRRLGRTNDDYYKLVHSSPRTENEEVFALRNNGKLCRLYDTDKAEHFLKDFGAIEDFTVVLPAIDATVDNYNIKDTDMQVLAINNDGQLLHTQYDGSTKKWSMGAVFGSNVSQITSIETSGFVSVFVLGKNGALVEISRETTTSEWRKLPIYLEEDIPSQSMNKHKKLVTGADQITKRGEPCYHMFDIKDDDNNHIHHYYESNALPKGIWIKEEYSLPSTGAYQIITAQDENGALVTFAVSSSKSVYYRRIQEVSWTKVGSYESGANSRKVAAGIINGKLELFAFYEKDGNKSKVQRINWQGDGSWSTVAEGYTNIYDVSVGTSSLGGGFFVSLKDNSADDKYSVQFFQLGSTKSKQTYLKSNDHYFTKIQATFRGVDEVFVIDTSKQKLSQIILHESSLTICDKNVVDFQVYTASPDETNYVLDAAIVLSGGITFRSQLKTDNSWESSGDMGKGLKNISLPTILKTGETFRYFGRTSSETFVELLEDKWGADYSGDEIMEAKDDSSFKTSEFESYVTEVTVGDLNGIGVANSTIYFLPLEDEIEVDINGIHYYLNPKDVPLSMKTDGRGMATFTVLSTSLHTPQLRVWTDFLPEKSCFVVEPNGDIQNYLSEIDTDSLKNAKKRDGTGDSTDLFSDKTVVNDDFTDAVNESMSMTYQSKAKSQSIELNQYVSPRSKKSIMRHTTHDKAIELAFLDYETNKDRHFQIEFIPNKGLKFHRLSAENAQSAITNARKGQFGHPDQVQTTKATSNPSTPYTGSFGDVFAAINEGTSQALSITVTNDHTPDSRGLWKGLTTVVNFVHDGVEYVWDGFVSLVEDAFDLVQSIFANVKVFFMDLFGWLAAFYSWSDILNTQALFKGFVNEFLSILPQTILGAEPAINEFFDKFEFTTQEPDNSIANSTVNTIENDGVSEANEQNNNYGFDGVSPNQPSPAKATTENDTSDRQVYGDDPQGNWFVTQLSNFSSQFDVQLSVTTQFESALKDFIKTIKSIVNIEAVTESAETILAAFQQKEGSNSLWDSFQSMAATAADAFMTMLQEALLAGLDFFATLVEALDYMLNTPIHIPLISNLYESIINKGTKLTILELITLVPAVTATTAYKLMTLVNPNILRPLAPVVSSRQYIQNNDCQVVLSEVLDNLDYGKYLPNGLTTALTEEVVPVNWTTRNSTEEDSSDDENPNTASRVVGILAGIGYSICCMITGSLNFTIDRTPSRGGYVPIDNDNNIVAEQEAKVKAFFALLAQAISPTVYPWEKFPEEGSAARLEFFIWVGQWVFNFYDLIGFCISEGLTGNKELNQKNMDVITTLTGVAHTGSFIALLVYESIELSEEWDDLSSAKQGLLTTEIILKSTQNLMTGVGEALTVFKTPIMEGNTEPQISMSGLQTGLGYYAPGMINAIRTAISFFSILVTDVNQKHVNV